MPEGGFTTNIFARSGYGGPGRAFVDLEQARTWARHAVEENGAYEVVIYGPAMFRESIKKEA
jgi:hypothetical protein